MIIAQGAEAILRKEGNTVVKDRVIKSYRIKELDDKLRKTRTRREAKILEKLQQINFPAPKIQSSDDKKMQIVMEFIEGKKVKEVINKELSREIGRKVGILHSKDIIHGDLTTSNMILSNEIKFIDFGLSNVSIKTEDKAVDLHLLAQALESAHHEIHEECFAAVIEGYKEGNPKANEVLERLEKVEKRGRNKKK